MRNHKKTKTMKNNLLITLLVLLGFVSCKTPKNASAADLDKAYLKVYKSNCLGKCKVYNLWVLENGKVIYKGISNVAQKGTKVYWMKEDQKKELEAITDRLSSYESQKPMIRDIQKTTVIIKDKKIVYQGKNANQDIVAFSTMIDAIIKGF